MSFTGTLSFWHKGKPRWCSMGNRCPWMNCKFYHKLCVVHAVHISSKGKQPDCQYDIACEHDHRDFSQLRIKEGYTEMDMWDEFMEKGLDAHSSTLLNMSEMTEEDRELLMTRLEDYRIEYEWWGNHLIEVYF